MSSLSMHWSDIASDNRTRGQSARRMSRSSAPDRKPMVAAEMRDKEVEDIKRSGERRRIVADLLLAVQEVGDEEEGEGKQRVPVAKEKWTHTHGDHRSALRLSLWSTSECLTTALSPLRSCKSMSPFSINMGRQGKHEEERVERMRQ